jgi:DNA-binding LytR/AlgR family response regulator
MVTNYSFAIPLDQSQCLRVILRVLDNKLTTNDHSFQQDTIAYANFHEKNIIEISDLNELPDNIIQAINTAHASFTNRVNLQHSFMVSTATGFHLLRLYQIIYFEYLTEKKQWTVLLLGQTQLTLKRNTAAENILGYSPNFVQINQHYIINFQYLIRIEGKICRLSVFSDNKDKLVISRSYLKGLQGKVEVI